MAEMQSRFSGKDWRDLAAAATRETDPEKLGRIIEELCSALDKRQAQKQVAQRDQKNPGSSDENPTESVQPPY